MARGRRPGREPAVVATASVWVLIGGLILGACSIATSKAGGRDRPPVTTLRLINARSAVEVAPYLQQVAKLSSRTLALSGHEKFEKASISADADAITALRHGDGDIGVVASRGFDSAGVSDFHALVAPMEIDSMALQEEVLRSPIASQMLTGVSQLGLVGVGLLPGPMRQPDGITRRLVKVADFRGARIGISRSVVSQRAMRALGADPVETLFEGADVSTLDGIEIQAGGVEQYRSTVRSITRNVDLWPRPLVVVANQASWTRLRPEQRQWLMDGISATQRGTAAVQQDVAGVADLCRRGDIQLVEASTADLSGLRRAFDPVYAWLRGNPLTSGYLDDIDALKTRLGAAPDELPDCATLVADRPSASPSAVSHAAASTLDGDYVMMLTDADIEAAGDTPDSAVPENYGEFRLVLDHGRYAFNQRNPPACTWGYGTYLVQGDLITLSFIGGGGVSPNNAVNKPGELFEYRWSLYRGRLTWIAVPGAVSPANLTAEPWLRRPTKPPRDFLHAQCLPPDQAFAH